MSYDVYILNPITKEILETEEKHYLRGGVYALGGTKQCWLNITFNYREKLDKAFNADYWYDIINGKFVVDTLPLIKQAIHKLDDDVDDDYWKETEGNVKRALCQLYALGSLRPDGIWYIDK